MLVPAVWDHGGEASSQDRAVRPWVWSQMWLDVLFLHGRIPASVLRVHVPDPLEIELSDEEARVSPMLFQLRVRPRWVPFVAGLCLDAVGQARNERRFR